MNQVSRAETMDITATLKELNIASLKSEESSSMSPYPFNKYKVLYMELKNYYYTVKIIYGMFYVISYHTSIRGR